MVATAKLQFLETKMQVHFKVTMRDNNKKIVLTIKINKVELVRCNVTL